jgi:predicted ATP-grasp superfamily ATP-dependent carboligase
MRIFLYEYTCASGLADSSLRKEGEAMLTALGDDFARVPGVEPFTPSNATDEEAAFRAAVRSADGTLVIAPECDDILLSRCRWVAEEGGRWLGSNAEAIRLTSDKLTLSAHLHRVRVPTPRAGTALLDEAGFLGDDQPMVLKPRFGVGSQATFRVNRSRDLSACVRQAAAEGWTGELILQPFVPGLAVSLAFLIGPHQYMPLLAAEQRLSNDGRFRYLGGRLPLPAAPAERARRLAERAVKAVPGLAGYVGVDLVLGEASDGSGDVVIEINPRLTTSYIGLRAMTASNLAATMLRVLGGNSVSAPTWRAGTVTFDADGTLAPVP